MEQPTHTPLWIFKHENFILKNDLSPQIYIKCIYVTHIMYIKCICIMYTKSLSLLSSAPLGPTEQSTARSEKQKWLFKRQQQQIDCFDKSNL